jgi:agmatine deiminase
VPTFDDPMDARALGILREAIPDREVIGIRCTDLVLGLGSIHCSTQQEPG